MQSIVTMRLLVLTLLGFSAVSKAWASEDSKYTEASSESAGSITTIVPGLNYTVQLDCIGCPFLQDDGNWESNPRSNAIVRIQRRTSICCKR